MMNEIADIISQVGIPFACFFAMFYLCNTSLNSVKDAISELKEVVSSQTEIIRGMKGDTENGVQSTNDSGGNLPE